MPQESRLSAGKIMTVTGPIASSEAGITDAHNHVWIAPVAGAAPGVPVLDHLDGIAAELGDYKAVGGRTIVDCQPGGCGRDGRVLAELARRSGVEIVACTGFHRRRYYPADYWLWDASADEATACFVREITESLDETRDSGEPVRAGFLKIACEEDIRAVPPALFEAAALAGVETGVAIEVHTEKGAEADKLVDRLTGYGLRSDRLVLCHMDKKADLDFHRRLAERGVTLEYDTFYRPKYQPDQHVWPLLEQMVSAGLERHIAIATDMAEAALWKRLGGEPGLTGLFTQIIPRLEMIGFESETITRLVGGNIASRLACVIN